MRADPGLLTGEPPPVPGPIGDTQPDLARAGAAGSRRFLVEGSRVAAVGDERRGIVSVVIDGAQAAGNLTTDAGSAANVVIAPGLVRRELVGRAGTVIETTLALPALPLLAVQWRPPAGAPPMDPIRLALTLLPGARAARYRVGGPWAAAVEDAGAGRVVRAAVHPEPEEWTAMPAREGGVAVQATVAASEGLTLLIAAGDDETIAAALRAAPHLGAHAIRAARDDVGDFGGGLRVATAVGDIDDAVTWSSARLRGALQRRARRTPAFRGTGSDWFWSALGAAATGDPDACAAAWTRPIGPDPVVDLEHARGEPIHPGAAGALVAARLTLVTGDPAPALEAASLLGPDRLERVRRASDGPAWAAWRLALRALADALRDAVPVPRIHELREIASAPPGRTRAVRLPMIGAAEAPPGPGGSLLERLLAGAEGLPVRPSTTSGPLERALAAWDLLATDHVDEGWQAWRSELSAGLDGPDRRGVWDTFPGDDPPGAPVAGVLLSALASGLLGATPDAPSARLVLAPRLPAHLRTFRADGIRVGDVRLSMDFEREGRTRRFRLEPTAGRAPALIVLEPTVPGVVRAARVDGRNADLEVAPARGGAKVRVQLPLDGPRALEIDASEG